MRRLSISGPLLVACLAACATVAPSTGPSEAGATPAVTAAPVSPRPAPTPEAAFGLTWGLVQDVERDADAFAIPSVLPTGPGSPNTPGHPGNFPGQSIIRDVVLSPFPERLVAVGFTANSGVWTADAWTARDVRHWELAKIDAEPGSFAEAVTVVHDPQPGTAPFIAVGRVGTEAVAWTSRDGATWYRSVVVRPHGGDAIVAERMTAVLAHEGGLLAGGSAGPELLERRARFWTSVDGTAWDPVPDDPGFDGAEVAAIARVRDGFVALGRLGDGQRATGSIAWRSADGITWQRMDDAALAGGLAVAIGVTEDRLVAVGSDLDEREAVAWWSGDGGASWERVPAEESRLHFGQKIRFTDLVVTSRGYVAVGNFVGVQYGQGTSWLSPNGLAWTRGPLQAALGQGEPEAVISIGERLVAVGSRGAPDNYIPSVWVSPNEP